MTLHGSALIDALERAGASRESAERYARSIDAEIEAEPEPTGDLSEHEEQCELVAWAERSTHRFPELRLLFAIPNFHGRLGSLTAKHGAELKAEGRKRGVPDLCLPIPRAQWHGLYIELKRNGGTATTEQLEWRAELRAQGYRSEISHGWHAAKDLLVEYLNS